jgi:hypothetical protein
VDAPCAQICKSRITWADSACAVMARGGKLIRMA